MLKKLEAAYMKRLFLFQEFPKTTKDLLLEVKPLIDTAIKELKDEESSTDATLKS